MPIHPGRNGGGRPKDSRNKLDAYAYACALAHAQHKFGDPPPKEYELTSLWAALDFTLKDDPAGYVARIISMLRNKSASNPRYIVWRTTRLTISLLN